jgi:hypothetical protein
MPHDMHGNELRADDVVYVPCRVTKIHPNPGHCNVDLETVEPMWPSTIRSNMCLNGRQMSKAAPAPTEAPAPPA